MAMMKVFVGLMFKLDWQITKDERNQLQNIVSTRGLNCGKKAS